LHPLSSGHSFDPDTDSEAHVVTEGSKILVVDDTEAAVRRILTAMLAHHGYHPLPASGGAEAVEL
jgi:hypothetical protein